MRFDYLKTALIGAWVFGIMGAGLLMDVKLATGWMLLLGLVVGPPILLSWLWREPTKTMSQSIRDELN
jgi:hypothetical protein